MDNRSAARFAAYKHGRGREYDDVSAARDESRRQHGPPAEPAAKPKSTHTHDSPLRDPAVFARRAVAARARRANG
jgi:hypothetical protein